MNFSTGFSRLVDSIDKISLKISTDFILRKSQDFPKDRHFFLYTADIDDLSFQVYEGQRAEAYTLEELKGRDDLSANVGIYNSQPSLDNCSEPRL